MTIKYLKKASKTASTDDTKTKDIVQNLLKELEKSKEEGCKDLTKKFDKYDGEIVVSKERIEEIKKSFPSSSETKKEYIIELNTDENLEPLITNTDGTISKYRIEIIINFKVKDKNKDSYLMPVLS